MKSLIQLRHRKFIGGIAACAVLAAGVAQSADSPAKTPTVKGAGASNLSGNPDSVTSGGIQPTTTTTSGGMSGSASASMPKDAKSFVRDAVEGNAAEVALAQVAERKAQNAQVKQFAEMIRTDHAQANQQLQPLAQKHGLSVNQPLEAKHQKKMDKLQALNGAEFDREYSTAMLKEHQKTIAKYEHASRNITDTEVQQYVQATLPKLRQHLQHAQHAAQAAGVDQATLSSLIKDTDAMGGTAEHEEKAGSHSTGSKSTNQQ
ncbi:MAG TPA: DUF4142 domain-containing protein [Verrucomicrobiae bacterium]|nr:DUF4142 domain-containing protein [Verrucomicrobiae bacterium]